MHETIYIYIYKYLIYIYIYIYIQYLDANHLYGWGMSKYLPYSGFKWLRQKEIDKFDLK